MEKMTEYTTAEYIDALGSGAPVPGGGGTSALCGALGAALGIMVTDLTIGKKKYAQYEEDLKEDLSRLEEIKDELKRLVDEDARVFEPLSQAYSMKAETEEEKDMKRQVMEGCLYEAALVPLNVMKTCGHALDVMEDLAVKGSKLALSDVGCGAAMLKSAIQSAVLNVFINTSMMKDEKKAAELDEIAKEIMDEYLITADYVYGMVYKTVKKEV